MKCKSARMQECECTVHIWFSLEMPIITVKRGKRLPLSIGKNAKHIQNQNERICNINSPMPFELIAVLLSVPFLFFCSFVSVFCLFRIVSSDFLFVSHSFDFDVAHVQWKTIIKCCSTQKGIPVVFSRLSLSLYVSFQTICRTQLFIVTAVFFFHFLSCSVNECHPKTKLFALKCHFPRWNMWINS